jgi:alkanesulfonate monooxygenase SsuD/methylene tetrahydromethanopterin reductase-like flavin-dependent oxidoreductase (luciferase family)
MLGAWAESTARTQIGALVSCISYRNPDLLADMARTVDHISGGRLILGLGAGFRQWEYEQYGYEFGTPGQRVRELAVALQRIQQRFARLNPASTRRIPLLVAASGPKMLRLVAQHADIWHTLVKATTSATRRRYWISTVPTWDETRPTSNARRSSPATRGRWDRATSTTASRCSPC